MTYCPSPPPIISGWETLVANIMSARMKRLGMTQKMLAEKMNCTQQYISKILKGRENLSLEAISKIENALAIHFLQTNE